MVFVNYIFILFCCKSFSVVLKIPYVKIQIFLERSFTWFLNYFLANFLKFKQTKTIL